jgi:hypothetical protein
MSLQKQTVPIIFSGGVDSKTDRKQVVAGTMLALSNGWYQNPGEIRKRYGYTALQNTFYNYNGLPNPGAIGAGVHVNSYNNGSQLMVLDGLGTYEYSPSETCLLGIYPYANSGLISGYGTFVPTNIQRQNIYRAYDQESINSPDVAYNSASGIYCYAYVYTYGGYYNQIGWSIVDQTNNVVFTNNIYAGALSAVLGGVQVRLIGSSFYIFYTPLGSPQLSYIKIDATTPTLNGYSTGILTTTMKGNAYDVVLIGTTAYVCYSTANGTGSNNIAVKTINSSGTISSETVLAVGAAERTIAAFTEGTNLWLGWSDASQNVKTAIYTTAFASVVTPTTLYTSATAVRNVSGVYYNGVGNIVFSIEGTQTYFRKTYSRTITVGGVTGPITVQMRDVALHSKVFVQPNGVNAGMYAAVSYTSQTQFNYYLLKISQGTGNSYIANEAQVIATIANGYAKDINCAYNTYGAQVLPSCISAPNPKNINNTAYLFPGLEIDTLTLNPANGTIVGLGCEIVDFNKSVQSQEIAFGMHVNGGKLQYFDGMSSTEHNFHVAPEIVTTAQVAGSIPSGTYSYVAVYSWVDNNGITHRSRPSTPVSLTIASGTSAVNVTVSNLHVTQKGYIHVELYRTTNGGTLYYLVNQQNQINSGGITETNDAIVIGDNVLDTALIGYLQLYTDSGKVPNYPVPAPQCSAIFNNRLFVVPSENPYTYWYSQQIQTNQTPVEFSAFLTGQIDSLGGQITAMAVMDDKLVFFKRNAIFIVTGQGPDLTGNNNYFSPPQYISVDIGAITQSSVVSTSLGIMFKSDKGICLLDRSLAITYIGAPVEAYNQYDVLSATLYANYNHVRFHLNTSYCLVFDYFVQKWSVYTNYSGVSSTVYRNQYTFIQANGQIQREIPETFNDNGTFITLSMTTSWFNFAPIQGFVRIYKLMLLGEYISPHALNVTIAYDFNPLITQTSVITPIGPYLAEYRVFLQRQKCTSMQFSVYDTQTVSIGESYSISAMSFEVGIKQGLNKLPAIQSVG